MAAEHPRDAGAIDVVHLASFPTQAEADVVAALRARGELTSSLVADAGGSVVGHVAFSPAVIEGSSLRVVGLGPVAVLPGWRRRGIAERLIREGLDASRAAGADLAVVVGDPAYYRRFGFEPAASRGLVDDWGAKDAFQVLELRPTARAPGRVHYAEPFSIVSAPDREERRAPLAMILATGPRGELGRAGRVPWDLPSDRAFFARTTRGHAVIMGRRTWEETGKPLPGRMNVVVSRTLAQLDGVAIVSTLRDAIDLCRARETFPFVVGGARLYEEAGPIATRVYHTEVPRIVDGADVFFQLDRSRLREVASWSGPAGERYVIYGRSAAAGASLQQRKPTS